MIKIKECKELGITKSDDLVQETGQTDSLVKETSQSDSLVKEISQSDSLVKEKSQADSLVKEISHLSQVNPMYSSRYIIYFTIYSFERCYIFVHVL